MAVGRVEPSSFGWHPSKKKKEMFHRNARYILVFSGALHEENGQSALPIAYSMFRFDREAGEDIIYW